MCLYIPPHPVTSARLTNAGLVLYHIDFLLKLHVLYFYFLDKVKYLGCMQCHWVTVLQ